MKLIGCAEGLYASTLIERNFDSSSRFRQEGQDVCVCVLIDRLSLYKQTMAQIIRMYNHQNDALDKSKSGKATTSAEKQHNAKILI